MGKSIRGGIIVEVIVLIIAIGFSYAFFHEGLYRTSNSSTVILVMLWVFVAAILLVLMWWRSLLREEMRRRFYLSDEWVYNFEIGYAPLDKVAPDNDAFAFASFAADALATMSYGFEVADAPESFKPVYLISTRSFRYHKNSEELVVVDQWKGTLSKVTGEDAGSVKDSDVMDDMANRPISTPAGGDARTYVEVGTYENARELANLLEDCGAFA